MERKFLELLLQILPYVILSESIFDLEMIVQVRN